MITTLAKAIDKCCDCLQVVIMITTLAKVLDKCCDCLQVVAMITTLAEAIDKRCVLPPGSNHSGESVRQTL
jgi:hypothetical protein